MVEPASQEPAQADDVDVGHSQGRDEERRVPVPPGPPVERGVRAVGPLQERAVAVERPASHRQAGCGDVGHLARRLLREPGAELGEVVRPPYVALRIAVVDRTADHRMGVARMRVEHVAQPRLADVAVGVREGDDVATRFRDAEVASVSRELPFLAPEHRHARELLLDQDAGAVLGAVDDEHLVELPVEILTLERAQAPADRLGGVVRGDHDRDPDGRPRSASAALRDGIHVATCRPRGRACRASPRS